MINTLFLFNTKKLIKRIIELEEENEILRKEVNKK